MFIISYIVMGSHSIHKAIFTWIFFFAVWRYIVAVVVQSPSPVQLFATPWTVAYQASLSMGFSRQEYWSGLPFPSPGDLPNPGIKPGSPALGADALTSEPPGKPMSNLFSKYLYRAYLYWKKNSLLCI